MLRAAGNDHLHGCTPWLGRWASCDPAGVIGGSELPSQAGSDLDRAMDSAFQQGKLREKTGKGLSTWGVIKDTLKQVDPTLEWAEMSTYGAKGRAEEYINDAIDIGWNS